MVKERKRKLRYHRGNDKDLCGRCVGAKCLICHLRNRTHDLYGEPLLFKDKLVLGNRGFEDETKHKVTVNLKDEEPITIEVKGKKCKLTGRIFSKAEYAEEIFDAFDRALAKKQLKQ